MKRITVILLLCLCLPAFSGIDSAAVFGAEYAIEQMDTGAQVSYLENGWSGVRYTEKLSYEQLRGKTFFEVTEQTANSGRRSMKITSDAEQDSEDNNRFIALSAESIAVPDFEPGVYHITLWAKNQGFDENAVKVKMGWCTPAEGAWELLKREPAAFGMDGWTQYAMDICVGEKDLVTDAAWPIGHRMNFWIECKGSGTLYLDDIIITKDGSEKNILANSGFEEDRKLFAVNPKLYQLTEEGLFSSAEHLTGGTMTATVDVISYPEITQEEIQSYACLYRDGCLQDVFWVQTKGLKTGDTVRRSKLYTTFQVPEDQAGYQVKIFVWKADTMKPISVSYCTE